MEERVLSGLTIAVMLVVAAFLLLFPRISRRGLLFGVYVGEELAAGAEARRRDGHWTRAILMWTALAFAAHAVVTLRWGPLHAYAAGLLVLLGGYSFEFVRSHRSALELAPLAPPPPSLAYMTPPPRPLAAYVALVVCPVAGLLAVGYTWIHLGEFPERMPVHFGASGRPDAYTAVSFGSVWMLPLLTLVEGTGLALVALLVGKAKRSVRRDDGRSLAAQERFRAATSALLAVAALLSSGLLTVLSIGSVRVAIGAAEALPSLVTVIAILLAGAAVGGTGFLALRYGQGGARLEAAAAAAPLMGALADNRRWRLGLFYFDPEDPSIFVEKRFGLGYTLNFGNWKAVVGFVLFMTLILGPYLLQ